MRQKQHQKQVRRERSRFQNNSKLFFSLLNALFSTIYFVAAFMFIIQPSFENSEKILSYFMPADYLFYLIIYAVVTSTLGSFTARILTRRTQMQSLRAYTQNILYSIIYALIIYFGFMEVIFANDNIMTLFINLLALKIFVSMLSNVLSSKLVGLN